MKELNASPIFVKTFDMILWLLDHTRKFPKHQRFVMAKRMEESALDFQDSILKATKVKRKTTPLYEADFHLTRLRLYNRMSVKMGFMSFNQYEYLSKELDELGKLLGAWLKKV